MNGHWLSGTRKLNKHYQSGQGGGGGGKTTFTLNMNGLDTIKGLDYSGRSGQPPRFDEPSTDNIIVAQMYRLFENGYPTSYTLEQNVHALYAKWGSYSNGFHAFSAGRWNATVPVWRFGEFKGDPYWIYRASSVAVIPTLELSWAYPTDFDSYINQNGIAQPQTISRNYQRNTAYTFEQLYNGKTLHCLIPVYEVIAMPGNGNMADYGVIITPNGTFDDYYPNEITFKNFVKRNMTMIQYSVDPETYMDGDFNDPNDNHYIGYNAAENGAVPGINGRFIGDCMYVPLYDQNSTETDKVIIAGTESNYNMIYMVRLKRLEQMDIEPSTRVLPFYIP